jgi:heme exporter protein A
LDEPTSALDAGAQASLLHLMQTHLMSGGMIIAATHTPLALSGMRELRIGAAA